MGRRFAADIRCNHLILKIVGTYITPLIEYCSVIWDQDRVLSNKRIEKCMHNATRFALQTPFRTDDANYVNFDKRMERCKLLTYAERRQIALVTFTMKLFKNEIDTAIGDIVRESKNDSALRTRSPAIFMIRRTLVESSPLHRCLKTTNDFREYIKLDESTDTTKLKLKNLFCVQAFAAKCTMMSTIVSNTYISSATPYFSLAKNTLHLIRHVSRQKEILIITATLFQK